MCSSLSLGVAFLYLWRSGQGTPQPDATRLEFWLLTSSWCKVVLYLITKMLEGKILLKSETTPARAGELTWAVPEFLMDGGIYWPAEAEFLDQPPTMTVLHLHVATRRAKISLETDGCQRLCSQHKTTLPAVTRH